MFLKQKPFPDTTSWLSSDTRTGIESASNIAASDDTPTVFPWLEFELTDIERLAGRARHVELK